jgi:hypothetical protein
MKTLQELQNELTERLAQLDKEAQERAERHAKEQAEIKIKAEAERKQKEEASKVAQEKAKQRKIAEQEMQQARARKVASEEAELDRKKAELDEATRLQKEKLSWLEDQITKAEFMEDQHKKYLETLHTHSEDSVGTAEIKVEHPEAPDNKGEAVEGTGGLQESPLMSNHLKQILRQANRS